MFAHPSLLRPQVDVESSRSSTTGQQAANAHTEAGQMRHISIFLAGYFVCSPHGEVRTSSLMVSY